MKIIKTLKNSIPSDPSHITNYKDTETFIYFLMWVRDKMRKENVYDDSVANAIANSNVDASLKVNKFK